jgi:signal transduction histidine kinase
MIKMQTTLAKRLFWVLVTGLIFISLLFGIILYHIQDSFNHPAFNPVTQMKFRKIINTKQLSNTQLERDLNKIRGVEFKKINNVTNRLRQLPIVNIGDYKFPVMMPGPFLLKHQDSIYLIKFNRWFNFSFISVVYLFVLVFLVLIAIGLCYWVIRIIEKPSYLISSALKHLSENVYADIKLANDNDMTKIISDDLYQLQDKLKKILSSRTEMLAAISHDLKTPITRIKLRAELLENETAQKGLLKDIEEIEQMINSIITFSKAFVSDEKVVSFNISELIESITQNFLDVGYDISTEIKQNIPFKGRVVSISRAISNVLDNAVKYGKENVSIKLYEDKHYIRCVISDTGKAIQKENFNKIIQPFFREDTTRNNTVKGSGLGLSIASEIIKSCGGSLKFELHKPSGLSVIIKLPK